MDLLDGTNVGGGEANQWQTTFIKFRAVLYSILFWQEIVKVMGNIFGTWMIFCHIVPGTNPSKTPNLGHLYLLGTCGCQQKSHHMEMAAGKLAIQG